MRCYKYISDPASLASILSGEMKFTVPSELNDPSELFPKFSRDQVAKSLRELRERGHTENDLAGLKRQHALMQALIPLYWKSELPVTVADADLMIQLPFFDDFEVVETLFLGMLEAMSSAVAVSCLSTRWDSLPMWAHYAHRARGAVVAYDGLDVLFPGDETGWLNCLKEVKYSREAAGITFYPDSYGAIFFSKLRDWAYESEVRIATELSRCTTVTCNGSKHRVRHVPVGHVVSVIMGWRISQADKEAVHRLLDVELCHNVEAQVARIHRGELALVPLGGR